MKFALVLVLVAAAAVLYFADNVEATGNCQPASPTANTCQGVSGVGTTTGGTTSGRCFYFTQVSSTPTCTTGGIITTANQANWELDAGACTTLYYFDVPNGPVPPAVPNKVSLQVYFDTASAPTKQYQSLAAPPTSGTSFTFCATSDGNAGSPARSGSYYLNVRAVKDNGNGLPGNTNYDVVSTGAGSQDTSFDSGFLRALTFVSSITRNAYPAGSTYAYGTAGDELITITTTMTQPGGDVGTETAFNSVLDASTLLVGQAAATVDFDSTSLAQSFSVDSTFPAANSPYLAGFTIQGTAFHGLKWTKLAASGHGSGLTRVSDTFIKTDATFAVDPGIVADSDCTGTYGTADDVAVVKLGSSSGPVVDRFNKGETGYAEFCVYNVRSEKLTRTMTIAREDATPTTCATGASTPSGAGLYSGTFTLSTGSTCLSSGDPGSPRYYRITNTDQDHRTAQVFTVSPVLYVDAHPQDVGTLDPDDYPTQDATETLEYFVRATGGGADDSDHIRPFCKVESVRHDDYDTSGSAVAWNIKDPTTATRASGTSDTGSNGWTPVLADFLSTTPLGTTWSQECTATHNGNTGTDTEPFTIGVEGGGETLYTGVDPMTVHPAWKEGYLNQTNLISITARFLDGLARLDAEDEILVDVYDPTSTLVVTGASPIEVGGGIYRYTVTETEMAGDYLVVVRNTDPATMGGAASNAFTVQNATGNETVADLIDALNDHRSDSLEIFGMSFNNLEFDGFLIVLFWFGTLLLCLVRVRVFAGFIATLGLVEALIPDIMPGSFLGYLLLLILAVWLEAIAGERIYSRWLNKKNTERDPT